MSQQPLSPQEIILLLDAYVANEATDQQRQQAEQLMAEAAEWKEYVQQTRQLRARVATAVKGVGVPAEFSTRLQARLREELPASDQAAGNQKMGDQEIEPLPDPLHRRLKDAVLQQPVPSGLRSGIHQALRQQGEADQPAAGLAQPQPSKIIRIGNRWQRWTYAAAAAVVVAFGIWGLLRLGPTAPEIAVTPPAQHSDQLRKVLNMGLDDHIFCAVQNKYGSRRYTTEEMIERLGPYAELLPILRSHVKDWEVVVGHRCHAGTRKFVHLILRQNDQIISLAITPKLPGDTLPEDPGQNTRSIQGILLFQARLQNLEDYEVTGFQTAKYLAFIVGQLSTEQSMNIASAIAPDIQKMLDGINV